MLVLVVRERAVVLRRVVLLLERLLLERVLELRGELLRRVFWLVAITGDTPPRAFRRKLINSKLHRSIAVNTRSKTVLA